MASLLDLLKQTGDQLTADEWNQLINVVNEHTEMFSGATGQQLRVLIQNNMDGRAIAAQKGQPCYLNFTFVSQERYSYDAEYENTGERGLCEISVRNADNAEYTVVHQMYVASGTATQVDVSGYLASGSNSVMIKVTGEITGSTTPAYTYTVTLTTLSIEAPNFRWWVAYTGDITVPYLIGGNISKTLHVEVSGENYKQEYSVALGTNIYTETAYNYVVPHPGTAGVYNIRAYLTNTDGTLRTQAVAFDVVCAMADEAGSFVAVNNVASGATNWVENTLFDYTVYSGGAATAAVTFTVLKDGTAVYSSVQSSAPTNTRQTFTLPMEIETDTNENFEITVQITDADGNKLADDITFAVDNSLGYSATAGAVFYLNPRTRSNSQGNRTFLINEVDGTEIEGSWSSMSWSADGWTSDADGNRVLRLLAGSSLSIDYRPFAVESARRGKTIEIDYKTDCVTDFAQPVLSISTPSGDKFVGLKLYPDDIVMYSTALKDKDNQSINLNEERRTRITLVITPDAYGNSGFNLCVIYVNGVKNREFTYENNDYFAQNGTIDIGSGYADIDLYAFRVYDAALTSSGVLRNLTNLIPDKAEKEAVTAKNDVMDSNGTEVDYSKVRGVYNTFVIGEPIPSLSNPNKLNSPLKVDFADHPEWNFEIDTAPAEGQGTSSMRYWRWNLRWKMPKTSIVTYADGTSTTGKINFTPEFQGCKRLTAKKNFASSMQSHKIGSVNSITDLAREFGALGADEPRISTYQLPFVGFSSSVNEEGETIYTFIGLYTLGPDKGDDPTFGYDTDAYPDLLSIEGSDNAPMPALFRVGWNPAKSYIAYNAEEEALQYNATNSWDYDAGAPEEQAAVQALYEQNWMPSYNFVYECSPRILSFEGTAEELNAQASTLRNSGMEYWVTGGDLYYYEPTEAAFIQASTHNGNINLYTQLVDKGYGLTTADTEGKTAAELNNLFIAARVKRFHDELESVGKFSKTHALFTRHWVEFNAATDNRAKNTYPYIFGNPTDGYLWKWRHDDMDTIWSITNQGLSKKGYYVEVGDVYEDTGGAVWNGDTSNFWNLVDLAFAEEIPASARQFMAAMETLGGQTTGSALDKIYAFFKKYYFDNAQEYFCQNLYNADAKWTYEMAKLAYIAGTYTNDTDPITQSMGDLYSAEQRWIRKRILYMMSKYSYGLFSADGTDNITVRAAGDLISYQITPAIDMYPTVVNGTSVVRGTRTKAGEVCEIEVELGGSGDQQNTIQAASYLQDIGIWYDKNVTGSMIVKGRMLRTLKLGDETADIVITISSLTISDCASLQELDIRRIATLGGTLNVSACTHLKRLYAGGTALTQIVLPDGGGLELIEFNALSQYLILKNYPLLKNSGVLIDECAASLTDFFVSGCTQVDPMQLLVRVMKAQESQGTAHVLKRIRATGIDETFSDGEILDYLADLADGTYVGLSAEGLAGEDALPVLDGKVKVNGSAYEDSVQTLQAYFPNLAIDILGDWWVRFADDAVLALCVANWDTNGDGGLTRAELAAVTSIGSVFNENTDIKYFDEFRFFTRISSVLMLNTGLQRLIIPAINTGSAVSVRTKVGVNNLTMDYVKVMDGGKYFIYHNNYQSYNYIKLVYLGSGCTSFSNYSFRNIKMDKLYLNAAEPPTLTFGYGDSLSNAGTIYIPVGSSAAYAEATNWKSYTNYVEYDFEADPHNVKPTL